MTTLTEDIIQEQLNQQLDGDRTAVLANPNDAAYILIVNPDGETIYEAAAEDENSGMWLFIENALAPFASDSNSQNITDILLIPNELQMTQAVAEPTESHHSNVAWWIAGGLAVAGLMTGGLSRGGDDAAVALPPLPKPYAQVTRYSVAKNPITTEPEPTTQADTEIQPKSNITDSSVIENPLAQFDSPSSDTILETNETEIAIHYSYSEKTPDVSDDNQALLQNIL